MKKNSQDKFQELPHFTRIFLGNRQAKKVGTTISFFTEKKFQSWRHSKKKKKMGQIPPSPGKK